MKNEKKLENCISFHRQQQKDLVKSVLDLEAVAILRLSEKVNNDFYLLSEMIANCNGQLIFTTGVGKSAFVAMKIAGTLSSIGIRAFFLDPIAAMHGDFGRLKKGDILVCFSNSGETRDLNKMVELLRIRKFFISSFTRPHSTLSDLSDLVIDAFTLGEADSQNMIPTCSTTGAMALGDALAIVVMDLKGITESVFNYNHPG